MTQIIKNTNQYFCETENEAEELVLKVKGENGDQVIRTNIEKKTKKEMEYFIVTITVQYFQVKDLLEV